MKYYLYYSKTPIGYYFQYEMMVSDKEMSKYLNIYYNNNHHLLQYNNKYKNIKIDEV